MEDFPVNPKDVQFFGKPIDYIAFSDRGSKKKCAVHFEYDFEVYIFEYV